MCYSATLAHERGLLSDQEYRRLLNLFSRCGLSMDHPQFNEDILAQGTKAILKTRDGLLRAAVPNPIGSCTFLNDVEESELFAALRKHKEVMKKYPRNGAGIEASVDSSDTGYTMNAPVEKQANGGVDAALKKTLINDDATNGQANGGLGATNVDGTTGDKKNAVQHAAGPDQDTAMSNGSANGVNGHA